jgi:dipeptidyl-peptidase 4
MNIKNSFINPSSLLHMKKSLFLFLATAIVSMSLVAQNKSFTIEDATYLNRALFPKRLSQLQWCGSSNTFAWVANNALVTMEPKKVTPDTLISLTELNQALDLAEEDQLKRFPRITFDQDEAFYFYKKGSVIRYHIPTRQSSIVNTFNPKGGNRETATKSLNIAYTLDHNIFVSVNSEERQVTSDGGNGIEYGTSVHRNEFGVHKGLFWSPKSNYLAFYRMDESMVTEYPLVDINSRTAELSPTRYPMAGMTSHQVTIGIYDVASGEIIYLKTGEPADQYLTNVTWGPDEQFIYVALLNRDQNHMKLNQYRVADGSLANTLFEEKAEAYVEPQNELFFFPGSADQFLWLSNRDGYNHLYHYTTMGELIGQLTSGPWEVQSFIGFDPKGKEAFFMGNKPDPLGSNLYSVSIKNAELQRITPFDGSHRDLVSADGKFILDTYSSLEVPPRTQLLNAKGEVLEILIENVDLLKDYALGRTTIFPLKSNNGDTLYCRTILPPDFDSTQKYPVFLYVYGGPHSQLVSDSWLGGANFFMNYMAQQGYVVFTMDNHGTANRGRDFEQAVFRNLGTLEMEDQMIGVDYLKSKPWIDPNRIGINGWSYGGFMGLTMALRNPGVFKVVVVGGPVIDWKYYEVMYGERYMDTPETNPEGYEKACLLNYVDSITGDILIIQGYQDGTVVPQNALNFLNKCIEQGKQVDFFLYPNHPHNVRGKDRAHLHTMIIEYFDEHL